MKPDRTGCIAVLGLMVAVLSGCAPRYTQPAHKTEKALANVVLTEIEYPNACNSNPNELSGDGTPRSLQDAEHLEYWDLSLEEAIRLGLSHSKVMLDLGGTVLRSPDATRTTFEPGVQESDPQYGPEGALSAFDAEFASSLFFEKNDRRLNNQFLGNQGLYQQDYDVFRAELRKRAVTGSQFAARHIVDFDRTNDQGNRYPGGAWDAILEGEFRQPILQGAGVDFNRIAGPGSRPGVYNGVLIARVKTDVSLTDFEIGVRNLVSNIENAYWDLYFSYRDLHAKIQARDTVLETWRRVHTLYETGRRGGEAEKEAQAREQYYRFQEEVQNSLFGRPVEGTQTNNGSSPGTFRATPGVYVNERRLRLLLGMPPHDCRLLRPMDEPPVSPVCFDWQAIASDALIQREELRRQRWQIKGRELELIASKNFLLPNFDIVGRYRWRGFGQALLDTDRQMTAEANPIDHSAYMNLTGGEFQEWQVGAELTVPIGFRQGHAAVRNAELRLAQARSLLREQERTVIHDLSSSIAELERAYVVLQTDINRMLAARQQLEALQVAFNQDKVEFYVLLDAQRRLADAEIRYFQSRVEYVLALRNVHFEKGDLLEYCGVYLSEGPWPRKAYTDAYEREHWRGRPRKIDYRFSPDLVVSAGLVPEPSAASEQTPWMSPSPFKDEPSPIPAPPPAPPAPPQPVAE